MPMNLVIQEKRKELGFTQEQIAEYLNVSIPAVSKWEKGLTSPDISLLPSLARLLKVDLNTLFCFEEDISQQEIGLFCQEVATIVQTKGIADGFEAAKQKLHEYPHNETLLQCLTIQLDGMLGMSELSDDEKHPYDDRIIQWYHSLAKSNDSMICNSANYMLASKFIRNGEYNEAQQILDSMPDREDYIRYMADKQLLQVNIYLHQGEAEKAVKILQNAFLMSVNKVQLLLYKMIDAELASDQIQIAKDIAKKASQMATLFDLWEYNSYVAPLHIASIEKNANECICLLQKLLATMLTSWDMSSSPLFYRIAKTSDAKQMLPAILNAMKKDSAYDFLQNHEEFKKLIAEYKSLLSQ